MKKNVLALSITAAMLGFGVAGSVQAMTGALGGTTATSLALNGDGVGHSLFVPYFSAQDTNNTLLTLVNTDTVNGKAVKVRFRGAANSDDIYDFQVFLSPGDVWTANVSKGASGAAKLTTTDASCTKPAKSVLNSSSFVTARLDSTLTGDALNNGTREGYVEIFNMGDIPPLKAGAAAVADAAGATLAGVDATAGSTANPLFTAIKHVNKIAPCESATGAALAAWNYLDNNDLQWDVNYAAANTPRSAGLLPPTTGLMANWTVINVVGAAAWTGEAVAVQGIAAGVPALGNVVYWPQVAAAAATPLVYTADPLFRSDAQKALGAAPGVQAAGAAAIAAGKYDLPDMSTPYGSIATVVAADVAAAQAAVDVALVAGGHVANDIVVAATNTSATIATAAFGLAAPVLTAAQAAAVVTAFNNVAGVKTPLAQANALTGAIAAKTVTNEFFTDSSVTASTDWVFSQPTRRYSVALSYAAISATDDGRRFTEIVDNAAAATMTLGYFIPGNTVVATPSATVGRQICVSGITYTTYDREETTTVTTSTPVISPNTVAPAVAFCGEASVLSINNGGSATTAALKANVSVRDLTTGYTDGWMNMGTPGGSAGLGLPLVGAAFEKAIGGTSTFGAVYSHRLGR